MRNLILFGLLILLLLAAQFATGKTVDEVIEKYLDAIGGCDRLAALKTIYMEGRCRLKGEAAIVKAWKEQDRLSRTTIEAEDLSIDPDHWWEADLPGAGPVPAPFVVAEFVGACMETDIAGPLYNYALKGHKVELMGKELVAGSQCYKIKLSTPVGEQYLFWIDAGSYLLSQSTLIPRGWPLDESNAYMVYAGYQNVDGIQLAHQYEMKSATSNSNASIGMVNFHAIRLNLAI